MRGVPLLLVVVPLEHREICDPEEVKVAGLEALVTVGELLRERQAELPCRRIDECSGGASARLRTVFGKGAPATMTSRSSAAASLSFGGSSRQFREMTSPGA